jgi:hypothetical protein
MSGIALEVRRLAARAVDASAEAFELAKAAKAATDRTDEAIGRIMTELGDIRSTLQTIVELLTKRSP